MVFEPFRAASGKAQVVNAFTIIFAFIAWVSTMVTFGSVLASNCSTSYASGCIDFYWNKTIFQGDDISWQLFGSPGSPFSSCKQGGEATLAFAIFAFLAFLIHLPLAWCRIAGFSIPLARDTQSAINIEFICACIELFCFFIQTTVWGGTCFTPIRNNGGGTGKGYGLIIASFFFIVIYTIFYFFMKRDDSWVVGAGATRGGGGGTSSSGGYESEGGAVSSSANYEASDAGGQPTFSYQANTPDAPATSL